jgi:RNA polymerase sigma-70 factor (ECF subfamily)
MEASDHDPRTERLLAHGRFLRNLARSLVAEHDRAEDLVQDTFAVALERPPRHERALGSWLARILRRLAVTRGLREGERAAREAEAARPEMDEVAPRPDEVAAELEVHRHLFESVRRLREPYRTTLYLRYYRGLEPKTIAHIQGVPVKTVKTRLLRGLEHLRTDLDHVHQGRREAWVAMLLPLARGAPAPVAPTPAAPPASFAPAATVAAGVLAVAGSLAVAAYLSGDPELARDVPAATPAPSAGAEESVARTALETQGPPPARARTALDATDASWPAPVSARLSGRVLDAAGGPLFDAEVRARRVWSSPEEPAGAETAALASTRTDSSGSFELGLEQAGFLRLEIETDGFAPLGWQLFVHAEQELDLGAVVLMRGVQLAGRVRDAAGVPVAGAEIWQERVDVGLTLGAGAARLELVAHTDERGAFVVPRQAVGSWSLAVRSEEHPVVWRSGETSLADERSEPLEVEVADGGIVAGRVRGALEPDARARVVARSLQRDERHELREGLSELLRRRADVAADGTFVVKGLEPEGEVELTLELAEEPGGSRTARGARLAGPPRRTTTGDVSVELEIAPSTRLGLRLVDTEGGAPVAGAEARLELGSARPMERSTAVARTSDPEGEVSLEFPAALASSSPRLVVHADGYQTLVLEELGLTGAAEQDIGIVELERAPRAHIRVLDASSGAPIAGAAVVWTPSRDQEPRGSDREFAAVTDDTGTCDLAGDPRRAGTLVVRARGHADASRSFTFPDETGASEPAPEVVTLLRGGRVEVAVLDADGAPLVGRLVLHLAGTEPQPGRHGQPRGYGSASGSEGSTIRPTDAAGRVVWDDLAPGVHAFRLSRPGIFGARPSLEVGDWTEIEIAEGGDASLTLQAEPATHLAARIRLGGVALAGARVALRPRANSAGFLSHSAITDAEGRLWIADLGPGDQELEVHHGALSMPAKRAVELVRGANELSIDLDDGRVRGHVTDGEGNALAGARVRAFRAGSEAGGSPFRYGYGSDAEAVADEGGRFELAGLDLATALVLEVRAEGRASARAEHLSPSLDERVIEFALGPEARLEIRLEGGIEGAFTHLIARPLASEPSAPRTLFLRSSSERTLDGLAPGPWRVEAYPRARPGAPPPPPSATRDVELVPGETTKVTLSLP